MVEESRRRITGSMKGGLPRSASSINGRIKVSELSGLGRLLAPPLSLLLVAKLREERGKPPFPTCYSASRFFDL